MMNSHQNEICRWEPADSCYLIQVKPLETE